MSHRISFIRNLPDGVTSDLTDAGRTIFNNYVDSGKIISSSATDNIDGSQSVEVMFDSSGSADSYLADMSNINEEQNGHFRSSFTRTDI